MKNTMKKVSLSLFALAMIPTVVGAESQFQGFYTGAGVGYGRTNLHAKAKVPGYKSKSHNKSIDSAIFDAFIGYGAPIDVSGFYLGGELGFGYDTAHYSLKKTFEDHTVKVRMKSGLFYHVAARLGYIICNKTLLYGRIGYQGHQHKAKFSISGNKTKHAKRDGLILGFGADYALTKTTFLRGEYKYKFGHRSKHKINTDGERAHITTKIPSHTFLLGLGFKI